MLSLCMIVRDEAGHIQRCLESVQGLVDEIIVVDTGSNDNTAELAKRYGACLYYHQWDDDFSKARNESLKFATGDWVLMLDADEVIAKRDHERIRDLIKDKGVMGYRLVQRTYQDKIAAAEWRHVERDCPEALGAHGYIPSLLVRLFRRGEGIRFQGVVHEVVEYSILEKGGKITDTDIPIHHYGKLFDPLRVERKKRLYQNIGEKKVALNPEDARAHRDLGIQYIELGLFKEAREVLKRAMELEPQSAQAHFNLGISYAGFGEKEEAKRCYREAVRLDPGHIGAYNNLAGILEEEGGYPEAQRLYENAIKANPEHYIVCYNFGLFLERRSELIRAIEYYEKVLTINPQFFDAYYRLGQISMKLGDNSVAMALFKKAIEVDPSHQDVAKVQRLLSDEMPMSRGLTKGDENPICHPVCHPELVSGSTTMPGQLIPKQVRDDRPTLSLCMIVKNEEEYLPQCLERVKGFVDEIVIVDTGSTDKTVEIAHKFGAKVIHHEWNNDFSEARNISLTNATGDWLLMLDADETIAERDFKRISELIKDPAARAYRLILRNYEYKYGMAGWMPCRGDYEEEKEYPGYGAVPLTRLYRRHPELRYIGKVHEVIEPSMDGVNIPITDTDIPVHHYGCVRKKEYVARKVESYRLLGESQLKENPEDAKTMCDMGSHYISEGDLDRAEELLKRSITIDPARKRAHFNLGVINAKRHQYAEALKCFTDALELDSKDASSRYNCGLMLEALGLTQEAFDQYREAVAANSGHAEALFRLASLLKANGYTEDAITFYKKVLDINPEHKGAIEALGYIYRGTIVFLNYGLEFDGDTLKERPLGGTETALINMAGELGKLGWLVKVFNNCARRGYYDGIEYIHYREFENYVKENNIDVFISVRYLEPFQKDIPAGLKIFWTGDAPDQPFLKALSDRNVIERIDRIFTVSKWQADGFMTNLNVPQGKIFITTNGVDPGYFAKTSIKRHPYRLIYSSTPFRGLDILLKLFPKIKAEIPDAELLVYSGMAVYQMSKDQDERRFGEIYKLANQPGVILKGNVTQRELAEAMLNSSLMAYPNYFPETSCISAMEAMAAGIPVVTSRLGALPETLAGAGIFIEGDPRSSDYQEAFVKEVIAVLTDKDRWMKVSEAGRRRAMEIYPWFKVAAKWDAELKILIII